MRQFACSWVATPLLRIALSSSSTHTPSSSCQSPRPAFWVRRRTCLLLLLLLLLPVCCLIPTPPSWHETKSESEVLQSQINSYFSKFYDCSFWNIFLSELCVVILCCENPAASWPVPATPACCPACLLAWQSLPLALPLAQLDRFSASLGPLCMLWSLMEEKEELVSMEEVKLDIMEDKASLDNPVAERFNLEKRFHMNQVTMKFLRNDMLM